MSGDTILAIIAVSLSAIFISVFAIEIECGSGTGHPKGGRWRSEPGLAAGKTKGKSAVLRIALVPIDDWAPRRDRAE
jgi:hypothetical protein